MRDSAIAASFSRAASSAAGVLLKLTSPMSTVIVIRFFHTTSQPMNTNLYAGAPPTLNGA
jgi:hypothetical protein